jgi:hypothetical protein
MTGKREPKPVSTFRKFANWWPVAQRAAGGILRAGVDGGLAGS